MFRVLLVLGFLLGANHVSADTVCRTVCDVDGWGRPVCRTICQEY